MGYSYVQERERERERAPFGRAEKRFRICNVTVEECDGNMLAAVMSELNAVFMLRESLDAVMPT